VLTIAVVAFVAVVGGEEETVTPPPVAVAPDPEPEPEPPVEAPVVNDENVAEEGSQETVQITITSDPENAEVWRDDELLGNTPRPIPRPGQGERMELMLRHAGYVEQHVVVSSLTAENVRITLERERRRATRIANRASMMSTTEMESGTQAAVAEPVMQPVMEPDMRRTTQSEVLDPWGN
jgi:hypothetical protein